MRPCGAWRAIQTAPAFARSTCAGRSGGVSKPSTSVKRARTASRLAPGAGSAAFGGAGGGAISGRPTALRIAIACRKSLRLIDTPASERPSFSTSVVAPRFATAPSSSAGVELPRLAGRGIDHVERRGARERQPH